MTLVDSDVLIAHLRGVSAAGDWLHRSRRVGRLSVSAVSIAEVLGGMRSPERHEVRRLLAAFTCEDVTRDVAARAGELRRHYQQSHSGISTGDYLIAATALERGLALATLNVRHFPMIAGLTPPFELP